MGIRNFFRRQKADPEVARRAVLLQAGRITEGMIFDVSTDDAGTITHIFFSYIVNGVDHESSQTLDEAQRQQPTNYAPGARVTVRYDPRQPANSVVV